VSNRAIGRIDRRGQLLDLEALSTEIDAARQLHPQLRLKLNTVVNQINHGEDLSSMIDRFAPSKWKILRMLPVVNQHLKVSDDQFLSFVARHANFAKIICPEDNQDMHDSYLMIDPHGRFFQNSLQSPGQGYEYSQPILRAGAEAAFAEMVFDPERFRSRYILPVRGVLA